MTVDPGTCLKGRETVRMTGSGFKPNSTGGLSECNGETQPTVSVAGSPVPIGCTDTLATLVTTSSVGSLNATFTIVTGIVGPPATGSNSAGKSAMSTAKYYPCSPTTAQTKSGVTCHIAVGDAAGDQVSVSISFVPGVKPTATKPGTTIKLSIPSL